MLPRRWSLVVIALAALVVGCTGQATTSFDPSGPCTADGRAAGAYPDLERRIPATYEGRGPDTLDSGRHCTAENLGSLAQAGFTQIRFAGGTWDFGGDRAAALVAFSAPGLTAQAVADFYAQSASSASRTQITGTSMPTMAGTKVHRLDSKTGDRLQSVVVWPAADAGVVNVVLTNDLPDPKIEEAIAAFGGR